MSGAELKTGLRNAAAQDGTPAQRMKRINVSLKAAESAVKLIGGEKVLRCGGGETMVSPLT